MSDVNRERLLALLRDFAPGSAYSIAPKVFVLRGIDYCRAGRLRGFEWNADFSVLSAKVKGNGLYSVDLSEGNGRLAFVCNCPAWSRHANCKHVVCALLGINDLIASDHPRFIPSHNGYRERLRAELHNEAPAVLQGEEGQKDAENRRAENKFEIVMEMKNGDIVDVHVRKDGRRLTWEKFSIAPAALRGFVPSYFNVQPKLADLTRNVDLLSGKYPFVLKTEAGEREVKFAADEYETATGLDASGDVVKIQRLFLKDGEGRMGLVSSDSFVFDLDSGTFSLMKDNAGWTIWTEFLDTFSHAFPDGGFAAKDGNELTVPVREFGDFSLLFPSAEGDKPEFVKLMIEGTESEPVDTEPSYRITISPSGEGFFMLRPEVGLQGALTSTFLPLFRFFERLETEVPAQLRAKKRRDAMVRAFFGVLCAKTKAESDRVIKAALQDMEINSHKMKRMAGNFLDDHRVLFGQRQSRMVLEGGRWLSGKVDQKSEALLYSIPYDVFGWEIFGGAPAGGVMTVRAGDMITKLPDLYERIGEAGISLFFDGKPVQVSNWDFSFDIAKNNEIDWFEIRPEIRCDGELVSEDAFMEALSGSGAFEKGGCLRIMDGNAQRVFSMLSAIYGAESGPKENRKQIVKVPRLRILDWIMLRKVGVKVSLPPEDEDIIGRLTSLEKIDQRPLPEMLRARLRKYQKDGYYWLSFLYENRFGACLADDMGLGKTIQAISLLAAIKEGKIGSCREEAGLPHLIVLPPSLLFNWENEIKRFCPDLTIFSYTGKDRTPSFEGFDVVLTTYGLVRSDIERLKEIMFDVVIFDEAQAVKNILADTTGAVRMLKARFKLTMTGTPLENHVGEYYSIIDLALPGLLGEYERFKPLIKLEVSPALDLIIKRTRPFVLRRTKDMILKELPPKVETDIYLELTDRQKALYKRTVEEIRATVEKAYRTKTKAQASIIALTAILKLRQICIAPGLVAPSMKEPSPKAEFLIEKLKELIQEGHSALVFSQFTKFLDILEEDLGRHGLDFLRLDGSTQVKRRKKIVGDFQSGEGASVFLLSLKAGGQGLNLTRASYVFHLDPWWNPAVENQASDRAHRIGQKRHVTVTRLLMRHSIEEKMMALKSRKLKIYRAVLEGAGMGRKGLSITKEDFDYLLG